LFSLREINEANGLFHSLQDFKNKLSTTRKR